MSTPTGHHPPEPVEYVVARIKEALAHDGRVAALDVEVTIADRVVILEGTVPTEQRRHACTELVRTVVQDSVVDNRLVVAHPDAPSGIEGVT
jgi:osmotically-inducible protein OsmY